MVVIHQFWGVTVYNERFVLFILVVVVPLEPVDDVLRIDVWTEGFPFLLVHMSVQPQHVGGMVVMGADAVPIVLFGEIDAGGGPRREAAPPALFR